MKQIRKRFSPQRVHAFFSSKRQRERQAAKEEAGSRNKCAVDGEALQPLALALPLGCLCILRREAAGLSLGLWCRTLAAGSLRIFLSQNGPVLSHPKARLLDNEIHKGLN
jgi:hypothetical protein